MARPIYQKYLKAIEDNAEELDFNIEARFPRSASSIDLLTDCRRYKQKDPSLEQDEKQKVKSDLNEFEGSEFEMEFEEMATDSLGQWSEWSMIVVKSRGNLSKESNGLDYSHMI